MGSAQAVALELAPDLPPLQLDRTRMRLLLRNLLDNALRHSVDAPQPPMVRLQINPDGNSVCITVRDYGSGVDEEALPHLAEPFYRPDSAAQSPTVFCAWPPYGSYRFSWPFWGGPVIHPPRAHPARPQPARTGFAES